MFISSNFAEFQKPIIPQAGAFEKRGQRGRKRERQREERGKGRGKKKDSQRNKLFLQFLPLPSLFPDSSLSLPLALFLLFSRYSYKISANGKVQDAVVRRQPIHAILP
jgi:hypothetical protein